VARYREIADELLARIAAGEVAPGAAVPSVRRAAAEHETTPATVARAYAELARLGVLDAAPRRTARVVADGPLVARRALGGNRRLRLAGSDDPLLDQIAADVDRAGAAGSFGGLTALWQQRADAATLHLQHRDGAYNAPFAARILAGQDPLLIHLWRREQGILIPRDNPLGITNVADLAGSLVALRASGTGTRVLLDRLLRQAGQDPASLRGPVVGTHLEAAMAIATGIADATVALRAVADTFDLDFIHLAWEPYELALPEGALHLANDLLNAAATAHGMDGYDLSGAGTIRTL
jgi:putative molybdopterin biosynthesis protein